MMRLLTNLSTCAAPGFSPATVILPAKVSNSGRSRSMRSEEHTSELQSLMRISYAVSCLKKKTIVQHYSQPTSYTTTSTIRYSNTTEIITSINNNLQI